MDNKEKPKRKKLTLDPNSCKSLREIVFETIRNAIVQGDMKPGERLMEVQLANELGVSRTPVRESIRKLELEGLVKMIPRKGAYVTPMSLKDLREMMEIRGALEGLVARLAADNASAEQISDMRESNAGFEDAIRNGDLQGIINYDISFHETLYQSSGNERLRTMIHTLREQMLRMRVEYVHNVKNLQPLLDQHRPIIDSIEAHQPDEAARFAEEHIAVTEKDMIEVIQGESENKDQQTA